MSDKIAGTDAGI
jgi:hypothetical protein